MLHNSLLSQELYLNAHFTSGCERLFFLSWLVTLLHAVKMFEAGRSKYLIVMVTRCARAPATNKSCVPKLYEFGTTRFFVVSSLPSGKQ